MRLAFVPAITQEIAQEHRHALCRARGGWSARAVADFLQMDFPRQSHLPPSSLEALELRIGFKKQSDEASSSGVLAGWVRGRLPSTRSKRRVFEATNGAVDLNHYVNHPLVRLASLDTPPLNWLQTQIANAPGSLRQEAGLPVADDPLVVPVTVSRRHCQLLRERGSVEAFLLLLALARHAELTDDFDAHRAPAQAAWDLLPRVVASTPWLQGNWRALAACLHRVIWSRDYGNGLLAAPPLPKLIENVLSMLRDPQVSLHLLVGPVEPLSREVVRQLVHVRWQIEQFECAEPMPDTIASLCSRLDGLISDLQAIPANVPDS